MQRPAPRVVARLLMAVLRAYRMLLSPWLGSACRFEPTCSLYALRAIDAHGAAAGSYLTLRRVARCHPWCHGGHDPVPADAPAWFATRAQPGRAHAGTASNITTGKTTP